MNREYDAIVVGGGLAGLTSAAYLCKNGVHTLLVEKGKKTGGLVNTFWHQGFAFDAGIRAFENSGILFPMLKNLGINMEYARNPVSIGIGSKWVNLDSRDSLQAYVSMLRELFPGNASEIEQIAGLIKKVIRYMDVIYGIDNPLFSENMYDREYLRKTLLPWLFRYQVNIRKAGRLKEPVNAYLKRYTGNTALIDMITQHFFKGTPTFFALSYFGLYLDYCYPLGGTGVLAQKMTDYVHMAGGDILTDTAAIQVNQQKHEIVLSDGQHLCYKKLVWAADQKNLYSVTQGVNRPKEDKQRQLANESVGGDSVLTLFMGVNLGKDYFSGRCGAHAFYTPDTEGLSSLPGWESAAEGRTAALLDWAGSFLERTTYEISCPVLRDASLAPGGETGLIVSTLMDYSLVRRLYDAGEYESFKQYCIDKITEILVKGLFPDLSGNIRFTLCATPMTIEQKTGNVQGAVTGWAFTNPRMPAENRFRKIQRSVKTPMEDIVQCGQWVFSPSGLPVSIFTGKFAADSVTGPLKGKTK